MWNQIGWTRHQKTTREIRNCGAKVQERKAVWLWYQLLGPVFCARCVHLFRKWELRGKEAQESFQHTPRAEGTVIGALPYIPGFVLQPRSKGELDPQFISMGFYIWLPIKKSQTYKKRKCWLKSRKAIDQRNRLRGYPVNRVIRPGL